MARCEDKSYKKMRKKKKIDSVSVSMARVRTSPTKK